MAKFDGIGEQRIDEQRICESGALPQPSHLRDALSGGGGFRRPGSVRHPLRPAHFFVVTLQPRGATFEVVPLMDARHFAEQNLVRSRRDGPEAHAHWRQLFDQTFI